MHNSPFFFKLEDLGVNRLMILIDGKKIANDIQRELKEAIAHIKGRKPCLAVVLLGEHPASQIYVKRKIEACREVGILSVRRHFEDALPESDLLKEIEKLNDDTTVDGILVQLPLPAHINVERVMQAISPYKDVDGFHPVNIGKMFVGDQEAFRPCTPLAVQTLLQRYNIEVAGKNVVICGRSNIVGKPLAAMLMQSLPGGNATVTVAHSMTKDIKAVCKTADILIVAIGKPKFITAEMVKQGAVVIDVGINRVDNGNGASKIVGDVDFENVKDLCSFITPVPGGVGPMTIAMLLKNTLHSFFRKA